MTKLHHFVFIAVFSVFCFLSSVFCPAYAKDKELVLIYTGQTHGALYPCNCPVEPDGGLARRATLIRQLKEQYPGSLLLDSGNFFSGGLLDQNTQNTQSDMRRAALNLAAMELMQYDAVAISDDEFNFGKEFLSESLANSKLNFLSANLRFAGVLPYALKDAGGVKVGIIGLTNPEARRKVQELSFTDPAEAVARCARELKERGAELIVLLSNLGERDDQKIIDSVPGIAVVIAGHGHNRDNNREGFVRSGDTVVLRPSWQGRKLAKAVLSLEAGKIGEVRVEGLRLSDKISDDAGVKVILPRCFADSDCSKDGLAGSCLNAGEAGASCVFRESVKVGLTVITSKECSVCDPAPAINFLKRHFPGLEVAYLYHPDPRAVKLINELKLAGLPGYLLGKEAEGEKDFANFKTNLETKGDFYLLKPEISGLGYFPGRKEISGKLDIFISLFDKTSAGVLGALRKFDPAVHFLAVTKDDQFSAPAGATEVEEDLRSVCAQKYYPEKFWDYIICRAKDTQSSWWDACASGMDTARVRDCARGPEGRALLKENAGLSRELKVMSGPSYLVNNNQIFSSRGTPSEEELKKIIKR